MPEPHTIGPAARRRMAARRRTRRLLVREIVQRGFEADEARLRRRRFRSRGGEWRTLFDGRSLEGWRGFKKDSVPAGWQVVDGALTRVGDAGDLITRDQFGDFELTLDWKIAEGGNSGIFYRGHRGVRRTSTGPRPSISCSTTRDHTDGKSRAHVGRRGLRAVRRAGRRREAGRRVELRADHRRGRPRRALAQRIRSGGVRARGVPTGRPRSRRASSTRGRTTAARRTGTSRSRATTTARSRSATFSIRTLP